MKKLLVTIFAIGIMFCASSAYAKSPTQNQAQEPQLPNCYTAAPSECHCMRKFHFNGKFKHSPMFFDAKKTEFEERLSLTQEQKNKLDTLHEKQMKKMRKIDAKIRKQEEKIGELKFKKFETKMECIKEFEKTLSEEQRSELQKIKEDQLKQMEKIQSPQNKPCKCQCCEKRPCPCMQNKKMSDCPCSKKCPCMQNNPVQKPCK